MKDYIATARQNMGFVYDLKNNSTAYAQRCSQADVDLSPQVRPTTLLDLGRIMKGGSYPPPDFSAVQMLTTNLNHEPGRRHDFCGRPEARTTLGYVSKFVSCNGTEQFFCHRDRITHYRVYILSPSRPKLSENFSLIINGLCTSVRRHPPQRTTSTGSDAAGCGVACWHAYQFCRSYRTRPS